MAEQLDLFGKPVKVVKNLTHHQKCQLALDVIERMEARLNASFYLINVQGKKSNR